MFLSDLPEWYTNFITIVLGLIVGSFLNVVIARLPLGKSLIRPGSNCPSCQKGIRWYDNLPVLSYLFLRGRCRGCKSAISIRYPIIEIVTAILFYAVKDRFGWSFLLLVRDWPFVSMLIAITFIDLEHRIIPDPLSLGGLVLGLATSWMVPELGLLRSFIGAAFGFGAFYLLAWVYLKRTGKAGLGGGDIKLLAMLGAFLGPSGVFVTILISSIVGSVVGIAWALAQRQKNVMTVAIPFGPFLVIGALYYYLFSETNLWLPFMTPM